MKLVLVGLLATACWGQQATLLGDAHVSSALPTVNSGSLSNLNVGGGYTTLVQFDLGTLPAGVTAAQITRATLRVYCNRADTPGTVSVQLVGAAWGESSVTYATLPALGATVASANVGTVGQFVTFDVTTAVQGWVSAPASNRGLALTATSVAVQFDSKENDQTAHAPELQIALAAGGMAVGGATGATGATGVTGATGAAGAAGIAGATGPTGAVGATGATGAQGVAGVTGATGAVGATGVGLSGAAGATGATGVGTRGVTGATGAVGLAGVTGATGTPGLVYQGAYSSTTNYALGDVVIFAGSSYASLTGANHGNTPGLSPAWWGLLSGQGPVGAMGLVGATGATGAQGLPGGVGPPGEQGAQGQQGIAGQAGAQGIPGVTGATGLQGPAGAQGVAGPVGMSFQGAYSSGANYALGDGVLWQGAGWVSLLASNHGNTPDQSPAAWAMFAAAGASGVTGATGVAGADGLPGLAGAAGVAGATGATGVTGSTGAAGLAYQGVYSSMTNYVLGDVVVFGGSSYASLTVSNHGNTPSLSPDSWGLLAAIGSAGPQGIVGPTGSMGPTGVQGIQGIAGPAGVQGPAGIQGPVGAQGVTGANGAQGAQGPQGPQGEPGQAGAQGIPGVNGATGATGLPGAAGATGLAGATGVAGVTGATGLQGLTWQGAWASATNYAQGDVVGIGGASYVSLVAGNFGQSPPASPAAWSLLAAAGSTGANGTTGVTGLQGATGSQGPAGVVGATGATGANGTPGINFRGAWSSATNYAVNDAVTLSGSTYLAAATGKNLEPDLFPQAWSVLAQAGGAGPTGAAGTAATISIGTVSTLAAGSPATVSNTGTSQAAVLNFGIPQGPAGAAGTSGTGSGGSNTFAAIYHSASYASTYYSVNLSTGSTSESAVLAWVPLGCTATRLDVYSQQSGAVKVTLRSGTPGAMSDTTMNCTPSTSGSCPALGSVVIAPGSFVDYRFDYTSGTAAGVWTSLQCN